MWMIWTWGTLFSCRGHVATCPYSMESSDRVAGNLSIDTVNGLHKRRGATYLVAPCFGSLALGGKKILIF